MATAAKDVINARVSSEHMPTSVQMMKNKRARNQLLKQIQETWRNDPKIRTELNNKRALPAQLKGNNRDLVEVNLAKRQQGKKLKPPAIRPMEKPIVSDKRTSIEVRPFFDIVKEIP